MSGNATAGHSPLPWRVETNDHMTWVMDAEHSIVFEGTTLFYGSQFRPNVVIAVDAVNERPAKDAEIARLEAALRLFRHICEDTLTVLPTVVDSDPDIMRQLGNLEIAMRNALTAAVESEVPQ